MALSDVKRLIVTTALATPLAGKVDLADFEDLAEIVSGLPTEANIVAINSAIDGITVDLEAFKLAEAAANKALADSIDAVDQRALAAEGSIATNLEAETADRIAADNAEASARAAAISGRQPISPNLTKLADLPIVAGSVVIGGNAEYALLATSVVGRTVLGGTADQGRAALDAQRAAPLLSGLSDIGTLADDAVLFGNGANGFKTLLSTLIGRTVLSGTAEQGRNALDAASAYGLYNATIGIGDVTAEVVDGGSEVYNGGVLSSPMNISIPVGQVGNISYIRIAWPFDGSGHAGKTFRFRFRLATSVFFNRSLIYQMSVATASGANVDRSATVSQQVAGTQIVVTFDYVAQGDETAIRPFAMIDPAMTVPAGVNQFFRFTGLSAGVIQTGNGILTAADENIALIEKRTFSKVDDDMAALRADILSQTILRPTYAETIVVKPSGGDFTTMSAAMAAITDSSPYKQYRVSWFAGALLGTPDFHVPQWTSIICHDPRDDAVISFANPNNASAATVANTSLLWIDNDGVVIEGGTWQIKNGRYAFHPETNGTKRRTRQRVIGLKAVHQGNVDAVNNTWVPFSQYALGCGVAAGQILTVEDCDLRGPGGGFSVHSPNDGQPWDEPFRIDISGTRMEATDPAYKDLLLKPIAFGPGEARIVGCSYDELGYYDGEWVGGDPGASVNTAQIAINGHSNTNLARTARPAFVNALQYGNATGRAYAGRFTGA